MSLSDQPKNRAEPRRGEVWKVDFPNRPDDPHLPRAAIVISNDKWNARANTVLVIPVQSDEGLPKLLPTQMPIPKGVGGLYKNSRAMCNEISSIDKRRFTGMALGDIPSTTLTGLVDMIKKSVE